MASTVLYRKLGEQFSDANGRPLAGYLMYYYVSGTDTLQDTYDLRTGAAISNPNPITLDSSGRLPSPVFLGDTYNYTEVLRDTAGVTVSPWPFENIPKAEATATAAAGLQRLYLPWSVVTHGPHTLTVADYGKGYEYDCSAGAITVNLPSAASIQEGTGFCIKKIDATNNNVVLTPAGTETIDGVSGAHNLAKIDASIWIISDGANWQIAAQSSYFQKLSVPLSVSAASPHTILAANSGAGYLYDCTSGDRTVNLPSAATVALGTGFSLKKTDRTLYAIVVTPYGSETIDGVFSATSPLYLNETGDGLWVLSDGANWQTMAVPSTLRYVRKTIGQIGLFPGTTAPTGWLEANGALLNRVDYPALWRYALACSNTVADATWSSTSAYGAFSTGNGSTTFRIPDLRGQFLRSWASDKSSSLDYGRSAGVFQEQANLSHTHTGTTGDENHTHTHLYSGATAGAGGPGGSGGYMANASNQSTGSNNTGHAHPFTTDSSGGTQNVPQNVALIACISYI
jgi:microcystin-dependent protein